MSTPASRPLLPTLIFGVASLALYLLLFVFADQFVDWARRSQHGERLLAVVPILVAFVFSYFHGAFTGHFWESLGLRAAKSSGKK